MADNNEMVTLLGSFSELVRSVDGMFKDDTTNGFMFRHVTSYTKDIKSTTTIFFPTPQALTPSATAPFFSTGVSANIMGYADVNIGYTGSGASLVASAAASPFLIGTSSIFTDGRELAGRGQISARQPFSHIDAEFDWALRGLRSASALFGSPRAGAGLRARFLGDPGKLRSLAGVVTCTIGANRAVLNAKGGGVSKKRLSLWLTRKVLQDTIVGCKASLDSQFYTTARLGWSAPIGRCMVAGGLGLDGLVSSSISANVLDGFGVQVATSVNHITKECRLGFSVSTEISPFHD